MTGIEWLLWAASIWSVFFLYCIADAPTLVSRWKRGRR